MIAASPGQVGSPAPWSSYHDWPRTNRLMPWLLAGFAVMLFLVPFHAAQLPVKLPVDAQLDRLVLGVIFVLWICSAAAGGSLAPRLRFSAIHVALLLFLGLAVASVVLNLEVLVIFDEQTLAVKKLTLLASFVALFFFTTSVVRPSEVDAFIKLLLGLACITAVGVLWERRMHTNLFWDLTGLLPGITMSSPPPIEQGLDSIGRLNISGPTGHGLAVCTMMAMIVPFALMRVLRDRSRVYGIIATALVLAAAIATLRKTSAVAPAAAMLVMVAYRPRSMMRLIPLGIVVVIMIHFLTPGSLGTVRSQLLNVNGVASTEARKADYPAVQPDILNRMETGRGYGTFEPERYRYMDNMYLQLLVTVGYLGTAAYVLLILSVCWVAHPAIRSRHPTRSTAALAAVAAAVSYGVANFLYDTLAFPQAPYLFMLIAGLAVATASGAKSAVPVQARPRSPAGVSPRAALLPQ